MSTRKIELRVAGILARDGRVLLVNHRKKGRSYWVLPGGHVERGETLAEALAREMREELALEVGVGPLVLVHDFVTDRRHVVNHVFLLACAEGEAEVSPTHTLRDARWVALDDLDTLEFLPPIAAHVRRIVARAPADTIYLGRL